MIHQRKILKAIAYAILLCFTSLTGAQPLYAVPANNHTPSINTPGAGVTLTPNGEILNIHQTGQTAVNKWNDFSIGADATVNFTGTVDGFNSFNYVKDGPVSEIYGQLNAIGGNIFIANPAGVQIGNSAQINVGSLYVTNRELEQSHLDAIAGKNTAAAIGDYLRTNGTIANPAAELMSLGSITSATSVTFDGGRIVLDTDRLFSGESGVGTGEMAKDNIKIFTNDENEVVLGYTSYTTTDPTKPDAGQFGEREYFKITANNQQKKISGYMWVEDLFQLQAMNKDLNGWYALRNAIDANYTADASFNFNPIGTDKDTPFKGRFDGLGYSIFGLNINKAGATNVGLFGYAGNGAYIRNFTINGGTITGGTNVGAAVGAFGPGAFISNITNTADVTGTKNVGGIVGSMENVTIAGETYNLGAVTGDKGNVGGIAGLAINSTIGDNNDFRIYNQLNVTGGWNVGGIVGGVTEYDTKGGSTKNTVTIDNVYSTGNIYAARWDKDANNGNGAYVQYDKDRVGAIWAQGYTNDGEESVTVKDSFFIKPIGSQGERESMFSSISKEHVGVEGDGYQTIDWGLKDDKQTFVNGGFTFIDDLSKEHAAAINNNYAYGWRIEEGTLPILYAFTPNTAKNEDKWIGQLTGGATVQYGTAANPLLTIIQGGGKDVSLDWGSLGLSGAGGLALYGGGNLTLTGFGTELGRYYNGIIFSAGDLYIDATGDAARHNLGSGSQLYGQNVTFNAGTNDTTLYGSITSTNGKITIEGGDVSVIGSLESKAEGEPTRVSGIAANAAQADDPDGVKIDPNALADPGKSVATVGDAYSHLTDAAGNGDHDITIDAKGSAEVLYGNMGEGKITTDGNFTVSGKDSVYVDSDLHIGGDLSLNSDGEIVLDLSNMGDISKENLHINFLDHFNKDTAGGGAINVGGYKEGSSFSGDFMIGLDMWEDATTPGEEGAFNLDKYDVTQDDIDNASGLNGKKPHKLVEDINALNIDGVSGTAQEHTFIWVENAEQLAGIQQYKNEHKDSGILGYNFALKDNIDASSIENYEGIASGTESNGRAQAFTGTFDGRGFAIIGLDVNDNGTTDGKYVKDAGIFGNIGVVRDEEGEVVQTGTVKDLGVYSSKFTGGDTAGAIAGRSEGTITGITTLGNRVEVTGKGATTEINRGTGAGNEADKPITVGAAGGIAGINAGTITNSHVSDTVIAGEPGNTTGTELMTVAGGVVGINQGNGASIGDFATYWLKGAPDVTSTSAVLTNVLENKNSNLHGLGGIAGINENGITNVAAFGVTNGTYGSQSNKSNEYVGGIAGVNYFAIVGAYNESVVTGSSSIGGIAGKNDYRNDLAQEYQGFYTGAEINNSVNAGSVTVIGDGEYAGGIVGSNYGWVNYGRNTGSVSGTNSVGGIAGLNAYGAGLKNLSNAIAAEISGEENVGGIAGVNKGEIANTNSDVTFAFDDGAPAQYVGGVAGKNEGKITNATNASDIIAENAEYVGGITGVNAENAVLENAGNSGNVFGGSHVGGVAAVNNSSHDGGKITNSGIVTAENGGAAGIFYENEAALNNVELVNTGSVTGQSNNHGTGGIIGVNSGTISGSTLANTGYVNAGSGENVGGLIGKNTGSVIGGRNEAGTMYVHKIYNNGRVSGGTNVGGLIGNNEGKLTAGYNTGNVNGQQNIGGIAGTNSGSISEVFNTVMTGDAEATGSISGVDNVGGLVGHNEKKGTLTDAYNTTAVNGGGVKGNAVGTNDGAVKNVYAWNTNGKLIGGGSGTKENTYSFVSGDGSANFVIPALGQMESESYEGFGFGSTWKNYDGWSLPMLKVFLTKGEVSQNGVTAADGLAAFNNANSLIVFVPDPETGGMYMTVFSAQIAGSFGPDGFNPNNLGYDLEGVYVRGNNNGFLHSDGWDRIKNFRERKAELYFHNGGMEYAEEM